MGTGGKANCLCLRGIWETPKPRYREETKPVVELPGTTFLCRRDRARHARVVEAWSPGTEAAGLSAERGDSLAPRGTSEFREVSRPRGARDQVGERGPRSMGRSRIRRTLTGSARE